MNRLEYNFSDVERAAGFLSLYFSTPWDGRACGICPCRARCRTADGYCEEVIAEWLEGEEEEW